VYGGKLKAALCHEVARSGAIYASGYEQRGAAGGIEAVLSALAIGHGLRYGNPGFAEPIPELGLRPVAETESAAVNSVLSNSFGFGGNCSTLIFAK